MSERGGGSPAERAEAGSRGRTSRREAERADRVRKNGHHGADAPYTTYRLRYTKLGRTAFLGHLDVARLLARSFRRAQLALAMSRGYSPKPRITYGPALALGHASLAEVIDVDLEHGPDGALTADEVVARLAAVCPEGLFIRAGAVLPPGGVGLGKLVTGTDIAVAPAPDGMRFDEARLARIAQQFLARAEAIVPRKDKAIDVRALVDDVVVIGQPAAARLTAALGWDDGPVFAVRVQASAAGSAKPIEVAKALGVWGPDDPRAIHARLARLALVGLDAGGLDAGDADALAQVPTASGFQPASAAGGSRSGHTTINA